MNEPQVTQTHRAFSLTCAVEVNIQAKAATIWSLLTVARRFSRWNSTVTGIQGQIREGERSAGSTDFTMEERFSGLILALVKGSLPDLGPVFERYANDLRREAERATG